MGYDDRIKAKRAGVARARRILVESLGLVDGEIQTSLSDSTDPVISGHREGLARLGGRIEDLMECFDRLQSAFGLPEGESPRFAAFFADRQARRDRA